MKEDTVARSAGEHRLRILVEQMARDGISEREISQTLRELTARDTAPNYHPRTRWPRSMRRA
jgi:hypothetical protein